MSETVMPEQICKIGKPIEIELRSIAGSTGYICALADKPDNIWLDGEATQFTPGRYPGQPGKMIFTFMGVAECQGELVFKYVRPWNLTDIADVVIIPVVCQKSENKAQGIYVTKFTKVVLLKDMKAPIKDEAGDFAAYQGNMSVGNFGISVRGSGAWASGVMTATVTSVDYRAIYDVYKLDDSQSADYWFVTYQKQTSHDELKKAFEEAREVTVNPTLAFEIQGNDSGISSVYITYEVIRLVINGITKDFVVTNPASASAVTPSGDKYPGGFKPK